MQSITDLEYKKIFTEKCRSLKIAFDDYLGYKTKINNDKTPIAKSFKQHTEHQFSNLLFQLNSLLKSCNINHLKEPKMYLSKLKNYLIRLKKRSNQQLLNDFIDDQYHGKLFIQKANKPLLYKSNRNYDKLLIKEQKATKEPKNDSQKAKVNKLEINSRVSESFTFYLIIVCLIIFIGILIMDKGL